MPPKTTHITAQNPWFGYPFGMTMEKRTVSGGKFGFNGKEKDTDFAEGVYDFGARLYDGRLGRFMGVDFLFMKYPSLSSYNFALNNPIYYLDYDGNDGKASIVGGTGSKEDPIVIKISANYYYNKNSLPEHEQTALIEAASEFNNSDFLHGNKKDGYFKVMFEINVIPVETDEEVRKNAENDKFTASDGSIQSFGNTVVSFDKFKIEHKDAYGVSSQNKEISLNTNKVNTDSEKIKKYNGKKSEILKSIWIHEIVHNLGLIHADNVGAMKNIIYESGYKTKETNDGSYTTAQEQFFLIQAPSLDKASVWKMKQAIGNKKGTRSKGDDKQTGQIMYEKK